MRNCGVDDVFHRFFANVRVEFVTDYPVGPCGGGGDGKCPGFQTGIEVIAYLMGQKIFHGPVYHIAVDDCISIRCRGVGDFAYAFFVLDSNHSGV